MIATAPIEQNASTTIPVLEAQDVCSGYGHVRVVEDLTMRVDPGEIVTLVGPNGAGKSTTLLTLSGWIKPSSGRVLWNGTPTRAPLHKRARDGLAFLTERRSVFMDLTTAQNLRVAGVDADEALARFPQLKERMAVRAGLLSGGEQQMLALARALGRRPKLLLADELSMGLAPQIVIQLLDALREAADSGVAVILVEQHVRKALDTADRGYVMRQGRLVMEGTAKDLKGRLAEIEDSYLARTQ
jgi:ABC-type branched-subunit amino acid transport system ATPase component